MKVLILSVTAGYGHHAAARAVSDQLLARGAEVKNIDVYQVLSPAVKQTIDKGYRLTARRTPALYRKVYGLAEHPHSGWIDTSGINMIQLFNKLNAAKFQRVLRDFPADLLLCTHVFAAQLVNEMKKRGVLTIPALGIVTDYTLHPYWEDVPCLDWIVTASELLNLAAVKRGLNPSRLLPLGIPIQAKFSQTLNRKEAAALLRLDPKLPTVLIMGGSLGYADSRKITLQLAHSPQPLQILAVCGRNQKQYSQLMKLKAQLKGSCTLYPYGFTDYVDIMMSAADCLITKPGGLTVTEALAKKLPMLLVNPLPGHEERNAEFLVNNGVAVRITRTFPVDEALHSLFLNPQRLDMMRAMMHSLSHPDAAEKLADFVIELGCQNSSEAKELNEGD